MFLDQSHTKSSSLDESSTGARLSSGADTSPGRSPGHSPAHNRGFHCADPQALHLQFQQTKQLRQQKLLSQVEAALALATNNSTARSPSTATVSSPRRSPCSQSHHQLHQEELQSQLQSVNVTQNQDHKYQTQHQQGFLGSHRSNSDREPPSPRLSPRMPSTDKIQHHSMDNLQASPTLHRPSGRGYARTPSPSSILIQSMRDTGSSSPSNVGNAANLSPSPPLKPLLQHDYNPTRKTTQLRRSPLAALVLPGSDGDTAVSSVIPPARDSPPSPFRPIQDYTTGSSPSPPHRPVRTQVAVEVHQLHHSNNKIYHNNNINTIDGNSLEGGIHSGNSSEEQYSHLAERLDRARAYVIESSSSCSSFQAFPSSLSSASQSVAQTKPVSPKPNHFNTNHQHNMNKQNSCPIVCVDEVETPEMPTHQPIFIKFTGDKKTNVNRNQNSSKDYDILKITEFSQEPVVAADIDLSPECEQRGKRGARSRSLIRYNDTGSLEKLNDDEEQEMDFLCAAPQPSPTVGDNENRQSADLNRSRSIPSPSFQLSQNQQLNQCQRDHYQNNQGAKAEVSGRDGIIAACGRTTRRNRALWRLRATLEEEEECSDTLRMEDMTTSPDDESADCEDGEAQVTTETPNTTSFESNNAQSDACQSDHHDSGIQFESCCTVAVIPAEHDPHGNDHGAHGFNGDADNYHGGYAQGDRGGISPGGNNHLGNNLRPNYENRRMIYRRGVGAKGVAYCGGGRATSSKDENSFDSVETDVDGDREGEVSDTSRPEVTSTSFESSTTTDNTDSTTESQASKLRQMKADSGYKSLETQRQASREKTDTVTVVGTDGKIMKRGSRANSEDLGDGPVARRDSRGTAVLHPLVLNKGGSHGHREDSITSLQSTCRQNKQLHPENGISMKTRKDENVSSFPMVTSKSLPSSSTSPSVPWRIERRTEKTASKKRREFSRDRQSVQVVYESIHEPDVESDMATGAMSSSPSTSSPHSHVNSLHRSNDDSFEEESSIPSKRSMFARFFKSQGPRFIPGHSPRSHYLSRDYSIDEKTNSIFNEFVRQDVDHQISSLCTKSRGSGNGGGRGGGGNRFTNRRSPRRNPQHKLQRKHTDPVYFHRSEGDSADFHGYSWRDRVSHGRRSDSSASSARRISPQDSIEEREDDEVDDIDEAVAMAEKAGRVNCSSVVSVGLDMPSTKSCSPSPRFLESQLETVSLQDVHTVPATEESSHKMDSII